MNEKAYSAKQEKDVLAALGRGLLKEFPNPERVGCLSIEVIAAIASHRMPLWQAEPYLDHLTSCSPCYRDFSQRREAYRRGRMRTIFAVAASVLIVAAVATWAVVRRQKDAEIARTVVVDLSNRSAVRGAGPVPAEPPLEIARNVSHLDIYLPLGSSDGSYDLRISTAKGEPLFAGKGVAKVQQGITSLPVDVDLSSASPGLYVLQLRKVGSEWNSYPLRIR